MPARSRMRGSALSHVLAGIMLAVLLLCHPPFARAQGLDHIRAQALTLLNQSRKENNLPPLILEAKLNAAAQAHAEDMLKRHYFAHVSPEGKTPGDRFRQTGGGRWVVVAENIATFTHSPPPVSDNILKHLQWSWMNSPGHRKNILLQGITEFGFGLAVNAEGDLYAVQEFAGPGANAASKDGDTPIGQLKQAVRALLAVNAARKKAGRPALALNEALSAGARAMLPAAGDDNLSLKGKNILDYISAVAGQSWATISIVSAACGGCGIQPVAGDVDNFIAQWLGNAEYRALLTGADITHFGFAISADGKGKKVGIGVLGKRDQSH
jgi:uncharacterized protein YkwD